MEHGLDILLLHPISITLSNNITYNILILSLNGRDNCKAENKRFKRVFIVGNIFERGYILQYMFHIIGFCMILLIVLKYTTYKTQLQFFIDTVIEINFMKPN